MMHVSVVFTACAGRLSGSSQRVLVVGLPRSVLRCFQNNPVHPGITAQGASLRSFGWQSLTNDFSRSKHASMAEKGNPIERV